MNKVTYSALVSLFLNLTDPRVMILFTDGEHRFLKIVSTDHIELNDTVMAVPIDEAGVERDKTEPGVQFHLSEVAEVRVIESGTLLYRKASG